MLRLPEQGRRGTAWRMIVEDDVDVDVDDVDVDVDVE